MSVETRIVEIARCCDCPNVHPCAWKCGALSRDIPNMGNPIPDWCPRKKAVDGLSVSDDVSAVIKGLRCKLEAAERERDKSLARFGILSG